MKEPWIEKLGFKLHLIAWRMIRGSVKRRLRKLGRKAPKEAWESIDMADYGNRVCMECCVDDLRVARQLLVEEHIANWAWRQPSLVRQWLLRDPDRLQAYLAHGRPLYEFNDAAVAQAEAHAATTGTEGKAPAVGATGAGHSCPTKLRRKMNTS